MGRSLLFAFLAPALVCAGLDPRATFLPSTKISGVQAVFGVNHFWKGGPTKQTPNMQWWDFTHPNATKGASEPCQCRPGYHDALDVTCHVDSFGHLRVTHPEMACSGEQYRSKHHKWHYLDPRPDRCLRRHWTGTAGVTHHRCNFITKSTCACCDCRRGRHHLCPAGKHRNLASGACVSCAPGRFTGVANDLGVCRECPKGKFTTRYSTVVCTLCPAGKYQERDNQQKCKKCAHGRFGATAGLAMCTECARGKYQSGTGATGCHGCAAGSFAAAVGTVTCTPCPRSPEKWQPNGSQDHCRDVEQCDANEYEAKDFTTTSDRICASHTVCNATRQYMTKPAGARHDRECARCPPGHRCDGTATTTPCARGKFQTGLGDDLSFCPSCPAGKYQPQRGKTSCIKCPKGFFEAKAGQHGCRECYAGDFGPTAGLAACKACAAGKYTNLRGRTICTACATGKFQPSSGTTACVSCAAGRVAASVGSQICTPCGDELWQDLPEKAECKGATMCKATEWQTKDYTATSDRVCVPHTTCDIPAAHQPGEWVSTEGGKLNDRVCSALMTCDYSKQWESTLAGSHNNRVCTTLTTCTKTQYISKKKTMTSDRVCSAHTTCNIPNPNAHSGGHYIAREGTLDANRICSDLKTCDYDNEYQTMAPTRYSDRVCEALTTCGRTQWETVPKTHTSDRKCRDHTTCAVPDPTSHMGGEYVLRRAGASSDRVCAPLTTCDYFDMVTRGGTQFQSTAPTRYSDRSCALLTTCTATQWEFIAPTKDGDRVCREHTKCGPVGHQWQRRDGGPFNDRHCANSTVCTANEWESTPPTATSDRICTTHDPVCAVGQYESRAPGPFNDRECTQLTECDACSQYETKDYTYSSDRECADQPVCNSVQWAPTKATPTSARVCAALRTCNFDKEWQSAPPTGWQQGKAGQCYQPWQTNRVCSALSICDYPKTQYELKPKTRTSNRVCDSLTTCSFPAAGQPGATGQYISVRKTYTSDRVCKNVRMCKFMTEYQTIAPSRYGDRVCAPLTTCLDDEWEQTAPTMTSNRICEAHTTCDFDVQWMVSDGAPKADRVCRALTVCEGHEWESQAATATSDRVCRSIGHCSVDQFETVPPTATSDRVCSVARVCDNTFEYESKPLGYASDRVCARHYNCSITEPTEFEISAPTPTSDRVCRAHARCSSTQWQTRAAGPRHDRLCTDCNTEPACPWNQYRWTRAEVASGLARPGLADPAEICGGHGPGACVYDCYDRFSWGRTNCFVGHAGTNWFDATTQWSLHVFPQWPNHARVATRASLLRHARGAAKGVTVGRNGRLVIRKGGGDLQIGQTTCHATEWETRAPDEAARMDRQCKVHTTCEANEWETVAAGRSNDRVCQAHTICKAGEWEHTAAGQRHDRVCKPWTVCTTKQFESRAPGALHDRECTAITSCGSTEFQTRPPTATSDRVCQETTKCAASQFEKVAPTELADRQCQQTLVCNWPREFEEVPPTRTTDRQCASVTSCRSDQHMTLAPTPTNDRECADNSVCHLQPHQFESTAPTATSDRLCSSHKECTSDQYEVAPPTNYSDRMCATKQCHCPHGVHTSGDACSAHGAPGCARCVGAFHLTNGKEKCDANVCKCKHGVVKTGADCIQHGASMCHSCNTEFHLTGNTCTKNTLCSWPAEHEVRPPTALRDRKCQVHTSCALSEYEKTKPTRTSDRVCTKCPPGANCWRGPHYNPWLKTPADWSLAHLPRWPEHAHVGSPVVVRGKAGGAAATVGINASGELVVETGAVLEIAPTTCNADSEYTAAPPTATSDTLCLAKQCTCNNGHGHSGSTCPSHGSHKCKSCDIGFHLEGHACKQNVCHCPNGVAKIGTACTSHDIELCSVCKKGFHLSQQYTCLCGPAGSNCFRGTSTWYNAPTDWTLNNFPNKSDLVWIARPAVLLQEATAREVMVDTEGHLEVGQGATLEIF